MNCYTCPQPNNTQMDKNNRKCALNWRRMDVTFFRHQHWSIMTLPPVNKRDLQNIWPRLHTNQKTPCTHWACEKRCQEGDREAALTTTIWGKTWSTQFYISIVPNRNLSLQNESPINPNTKCISDRTRQILRYPNVYFPRRRPTGSLRRVQFPF